MNGPGIDMTPGLLRMPPGLGENAPDALLPIAPFIRALAGQSDQARLEWAFLRNAEGLPWHTRYDLDVLVAPNHRDRFLRIVETCAAETGWQVAGRIHKRHYDCLMLAKGTPDKVLFFLPLDVFTALEYRGLCYGNAREVLQTRLRNPDGFWNLPPGWQAAIGLLKEWLPHRRWKEADRRWIRSMAGSDPEGFRRALGSAVGPASAGRLADAIRSDADVPARTEDRALRRELRRRNPAWLLAVADAGWRQLAHLFRPSLGFVVCLAGADGSGKTTLARGLFEQAYKRPFKACRYFHGNAIVLPRFRDMRAAFRRRLGMPSPATAAEPPPPKALQGMMEPLPGWKSVLLAAYYTFDAWLARIPLRLWRGQWSLIVMDRSFYDYYYQLGHRRCPHRVLNILSRLVPKPDLLLCIEDDPERIHTRKPELTVEEIRAEQDILRRLAARLPFALRLDGTGGVETMIEAGRRAVLERLLPDSRREEEGSPGLYFWQWGSRPLMAYPAGRRAGRLRAIDLFPRSSSKRRLLHAGIRMLAAIGLDGVIAGRCAPTGDMLSREELDALLDDLRKAGADPAEWLMAWPARPERRRLYLVFRDAVTSRIGVVKIGVGDFNRAQFLNESTMLQKLQEEPHPFTVPRVIFVREIAGGRTVLALGGFPSRLRPMSADTASRWSRTVIGHLVSLGSGPRVHGDLGPGNMLMDDGGGLFLFDWENASSDAPALVDEIGFWLSLRQALVLGHPRGQAGHLRQAFAQAPEPDIRAALEFLRARDNLAAAKILEAWR